jgi:hypothetical protein
MRAKPAEVVEERVKDQTVGRHDFEAGPFGRGNGLVTFCEATSTTDTELLAGTPEESADVEPLVER